MKFSLWSRPRAIVPRGAALLGVGLAAFTAGAAGAQPAHVARDLDAAVRKAPQARQRVIALLNGSFSPQFARRVRAHGGQVRQQFSALGTVVFDLPGAALAGLAQDPDIRALSPDRVLRAHLDYTCAAIGASTALASGIGGAGVSVAVLDTGIAPHPDLTAPTNRIVGWVDLVNNQPAPYDDEGHGTHVAGIIAGNGALARSAGNPRRLNGVAPQATLVGVKVLTGAGTGMASTVIAGLNWCITNQARYGIRVVNLSLGHAPGESFATDPLCQACESATRAGLLVVCAAGNRGRTVASDPNSPIAYRTIDSPGSDPYVLTVGAAKTLFTFDTSDDQVSSYSSRGPTASDCHLKPYLIAQGNHVS